MITNVAIIGNDKESVNKTVDSLRQFDNISCVSVLASPTLLNKSLEKDAEYLMLCEAGDIFEESYLPVCRKFLEENSHIGGVYTDFTLNGHRIFSPSFCRQRLVREVVYPNINCILRKNLLPPDFFKSGDANEIYLDFSDRYAMYHIAESLVHKTI